MMPTEKTAEAVKKEMPNQRTTPAKDLVFIELKNI